MELRNLQSFLRVAELGNFTKAAGELGDSQASITLHIKQLEEELGAPLFNRIGNNTILTPIGEKLVEYANQMQCIHENINALSSGDPKTLRGTLRLGAVESVSALLIVPALEIFKKEYPYINVEVSTGYRKTLFETLRKNETDMIFTIGTLDAPEFCVEIFSFKEEACFFARRDHPLAGKVCRAAELFEYPFILTGKDSFLERELSRLADFYGKSIESFIRCDITNTILQLVNRGLGISFLGSFNLRPGLTGGKLVRLEVEDYSFCYDICAYRNRHKWVSPHMSGFIAALEQVRRRGDSHS